MDSQGPAGAAQYTRAGTEPSGWDRKIFEFTAREATTTLEFVHDFGGANYSGLDNISIRAVPAPAGLAIFGLAGLRSRRRR